MTQHRQMRLGVFVQTPGHHVAGWRHPDATATGWPNLPLMQHIATTASTTYAEPYHVARSFASLDHLSGGRAGWNVVTTAYAKSSAVFGRHHPPHAERYAMAEEFVEACRLLWDSWDDDAFIGDKAKGQFVRPGSLHVPQ